MKRQWFTLSITVVLALLGTTAWADDNMMTAPAMSGSSSMSGTSTMTQSNSLSGAGSMTQPNTMSGQAAQGSAPMADPKVGNELRYAPSAAHKVIFTNIAAAETYAANGPAVLFFAADWCPYCQADLTDINEHGAMLGKDITIVVVNYDTAHSLEARYGVTVQDTFVQIDRNGTMITAWNGGGVDGINSHVMRM